ncbi:hypothetical protein LXL04_036727 [Taraxacum kok-saghyz]
MKKKGEERRSDAIGERVDNAFSNAYSIGRTHSNGIPVPIGFLNCPSPSKMLPALREINFLAIDLHRSLLLPSDFISFTPAPSPSPAPSPAKLGLAIYRLPSSSLFLKKSYLDKKRKRNHMRDEEGLQKRDGVERLSVSSPIREIVERASQLDVVLTNRLARRRSQEYE